MGVEPAGDASQTFVKTALGLPNTSSFKLNWMGKRNKRVAGKLEPISEFA
jgi:hypothetical protein